MTKQELAHIVRLMYGLQEYCKWLDSICNICPLQWHNNVCRIKKYPSEWNITKADIERLERESNDD